MSEKIICPNCLKQNDKWSDYCSFCGQFLKKEEKTNEEKKRLAQQEQSTNDAGVAVSAEPFPTKTVIVHQQAKDDHPWWKPIKRKRRWYNPLEWLFWLGWGLYVIFRFLLVEVFRYLKWCVCWGHPEELKKK